MGNSNITPLQRGINHAQLNQHFLKNIGEEAIQSTAKIIEHIADQLQIPEHIIIQKIKSLKHKTFYNMDDITREVLNLMLKDENTLNYVEDFDKEKQKIIKKEKPNQIFISS